MCCIRLRVCYTSAALCSAAVIRMLQAQARFPTRRSRLRLRMAATVPAQTSVVCELLSVTECPESECHHGVLETDPLRSDPPHHPPAKRGRQHPRPVQILIPRQEMETFIITFSRFVLIIAINIIINNSWLPTFIKTESGDECCSLSEMS